MDADGSNVRRVSFGGLFHDESTWAYDGTRIACTTRDEGNFQIATIDAVTTDRMVIPAPGNNESPCFSPEGIDDRLRVGPIRQTPDLHHRRQWSPHQLTTEGSNHSPTWIGATRINSQVVSDDRRLASSMNRGDQWWSQSGICVESER